MDAKKTRSRSSDRDGPGARIADRRSFLKLAGAGAVTGTAAIAGGEAEAATAAEKPKTGLYRETEHVKRYYELAR